MEVFGSDDFFFNWQLVGHVRTKPVEMSYYLENKLLLISINFTAKPAIGCLSKNCTFLGFLRRYLWPANKCGSLSSHLHPHPPRCGWGLDLSVSDSSTFQDSSDAVQALRKARRFGRENHRDRSFIAGSHFFSHWEVGCWFLFLLKWILGWCLFCFLGDFCS